VTHQTDRFTQDTREGLKDLNCGAEAVDQSPIIVAVFLKSLLPLLEQLENSLRRI
jgi:hypothetical protein